MASAGEARFGRELVTPEGVDLQVTLGPMTARMGAFLLDLAILFGFVLLLRILTQIAGISVASLGVSRLEGFGIIWILGVFGLKNAYFIMMESGGRGATLGKRAYRLRVAAHDGGRLDLDAVVARNLMRDLEFFLPLTLLGARAGGDGIDGLLAALTLGWAGLFLLFPLFNRDRLRAGDLIAGTWVIRAPRRELLADVAAGTMARPMATEVFTATELDAYGIHELQTLEDVLRRENTEAVRAVAAAIRGRIGRPAYAGSAREDFAFLSAYYAALRARLETNLLFGRRRENRDG